MPSERRISRGAFVRRLEAAGFALAAERLGVARKAPKNTALPVITGTPVVGGTLYCSIGSWTGNPSLYLYQWLLCDSSGANPVAIPGATDSRFTIPLADAGLSLRCQVIAVNAGGSSAPTVTYPTTVVSPSISDPPAIAGLGYSLVLNESFASLDANPDASSLNNTNYWQNFWYASGGTGTPAGSKRPSPWPSGSVYSDGNSLFFDSKASDLYPRLGMTTRRLTQLGSSAWQYGYFETKAWFTPNPSASVGSNGTWMAFWMTGLAHIFDATQMNPELDIGEIFASRWLSNNPANAPNTEDLTGWFSGTLHKNTGGGNGVADQTNANAFNNTGSTLAGAWHKMAALWTPTTVSWYLDDTLMHSTPVFTTTNQLMVMYLSQDIGWWDGSNPASGSQGVGGNVINTSIASDPVRTKFDYVRVWQDSSGIRQ